MATRTAPVSTSLPAQDYSQVINVTSARTGKSRLVLLGPGRREGSAVAGPDGGVETPLKSFMHGHGMAGSGIWGLGLGCVVGALQGGGAESCPPSVCLSRAHLDNRPRAPQRAVRSSAGHPCPGTGCTWRRFLYGNQTHSGSPAVHPIMKERAQDYPSKHAHLSSLRPRAAQRGWGRYKRLMGPPAGPGTVTDTQRGGGTRLHLACLWGTQHLGDGTGY